MSSKWCMEVIHRFEEILNFVRNKWKSSIDSISPRSTISHNITFIIDAYWRPIKNYANEKFCGCESKIEHISQLNSKLSISIDNDCHTRDIMQIQSDTWFVKIEFNACIRMAERQNGCFLSFWETIRKSHYYKLITFICGCWMTGWMLCVCAFEMAIGNKLERTDCAPHNLSSLKLWIEWKLGKPFQRCWANFTIRAPRLRIRQIAHFRYSICCIGDVCVLVCVVWVRESDWRT